MNEEVVRVDVGFCNHRRSYGCLLRKSPRYTFELADDLFVRLTKSDFSRDKCDISLDYPMGV